MKTIKQILLAGMIGLTVNSCYDMDLEPKGILDESTLFGNEYGIEKYFAGLYNYLPIEDFNYHAEQGYRYDNYWDACKGSLSSCAAETTGWIEARGDGTNYWPYDRIRDVNVFIHSFPQYKDKYSDEQYNALLGEARFLRAFYYFGLAKRYGGVPLVSEVQDVTAPVETLQLPRSTELDTWQFIYDDLDFAMHHMVTSSATGRANRYAAAALMSRAMLYAGSIAKYGSYSNLGGEAAEKGLVGIPADKAEFFFRAAYDAAKFIPEGTYGLYETNPDKEQNYVDMLLDDSKANREDIFIKQYGKNSPHNTHLFHSWDASMLPNPDFSPDLESVMYPLFDLVKLFDMPAIVDGENRPVRFDKREDLLAGMEPRLKAVVYFSGMELRDKKFDIQRGIYKTFPGTIEEARRGSNDAPFNIENRIIAQNKGDLWEGLKICGDHGYAIGPGGANNTRTGMFVRKYVDYRVTRESLGLYKSVQSFKVFRYGEVLLNWAEAAYELGLILGDDHLKREAFEQIAKIRNRAGASERPMEAVPSDLTGKYGYPMDSNLQYIRDERARELCFENHRWWDIRRWRIADQLLNNFMPCTLTPYYVADEGKYIFLEEDELWNKRWTFQKKWYYEPLPWGEINKNPNLKPQNPIY